MASEGSRKKPVAGARAAQNWAAGSGAADGLGGGGLATGGGGDFAKGGGEGGRGRG